MAKYARAKKLWKELSFIPVNENGQIEQQFDEFSIGTPREEIWHWFEENYNLSIVNDLMGTENE